MTLESIAPLSDTPIVGLPAVATCPTRQTPAKTLINDGLLQHAAGQDHHLRPSPVKPTCPGLIEGALQVHIHPLFEEIQGAHGWPRSGVSC